MATTWQVGQRRQEFVSLSFDEMVEKIIDLESGLDAMTAERDDLVETVAQLEKET